MEAFTVGVVRNCRHGPVLLRAMPEKRVVWRVIDQLHEKALLPAGINDVLSPDAAFEAATLERLIAVFTGYGYQRVKPPLIEFEENLLAGLGAAMGEQTFRLMDPVSQRMMGVRADMTPQVARIAATRLAGTPRPLRLSYAGQVLRVTGSQLRPERQFAQVGAEIIGADESAADSELVRMATTALTALGVERLSVDLGIPTLVPTFCTEAGLNADLQGRLRPHLDRKDVAAIKAMATDIGDDAATTLAAMLTASGPAEQALAALNALNLGPKASAERTALADVVDLVSRGATDLPLTIDAVENRGFEYHSGVTFTFFALGVRGELGTGGRYLTSLNGDAKEPATGLTLFMDSVLRALDRGETPRRLYLPHGSTADAAPWRAEGWAVIEGLKPAADAAIEARRLGCTYVVDGEDIHQLT